MSESKAAAIVSGENIAESIDEREYRALETVLTQTARGRAFLREHLHRHGTAAAPVVEQPLPSGEAMRILAAIGELHEAIRAQQNQPTVAHVRMDILEMGRAISRTRSEISSMRTQGSYDQLTVATGEMDAIAASTEKATNAILQSAERIQEIAWQLRENGVEVELCETIDNCATDIYMACSFQDLTGQRTTKVVRVLQYLEARVNSMIDIWGLAGEAGEPAHDKASADGRRDEAEVPPLSSDPRPDAHLLNGPQMEVDALDQDNIDELLGGFDAIDADVETVADDAFATAEAFSPVPSDEADADTAMQAFDAGDDIDEEKLKALFG